MKTAILYLRVSTDEQAFGFSLSDQRQRLSEYCNKSQIEVKAIFQDDFTGKTFNRPGFNKLLSYLKSNKADSILFTKWSRFSRNTADSYAMIKQLHSLGVVVNSIDEPLDLSIPQNLILQAIHLSMPEVDNLMRSENTRRGMRRGMREGRYLSTAPQGYINSRDKNGKPILTIDEGKAPLVREMFELIAQGKPQQVVRREMYSKGLRYCRTKFKTALLNPIYIGKIKIEAFKGEPEEIVQGIHQPIVDQTTFYKVQDRLNGKPRNRPTILNDDMPLRGLLYCSAADHRLTGSCSKGHGGLYHYYHCANVNCERHRADKINQAYINLLEKWKAAPEDADLYCDMLALHFDTLRRPDKQKANALQKQLENQKERLKSLQDKWIDNLISNEDYESMKTRYESTIYDLKEQLEAFSNMDNLPNFTEAVKALTILPDLYQSFETEEKREMIGWITPGKLYLKNGLIEPTEVNYGISLIATIDKGLPTTQTLHKVEYKPNVLPGSPSSTQVRTLSGDLQLLSELFKRVA